jgi:hypothetical protein
VNQKKCPKCGEMNPPEAVMCWACYTPLTGAGAVPPPGAVPAAGGRAVGQASGGSEDKEKTKIPAWQLGVIGAAVLVGVVFGAMQFMGGSTPEEVVDPTTGTEIKKPAPPTTTTTTTTTAPGAPPPAVPGQGGAPPVEAPFTVIASPNTRYTAGTMAILARNPSLSPRQAAGLASFALRQLTNANKYRVLHIFVFSDSEAAQKFSDYQNAHGNQPLTPEDYASPDLQAIWPLCLARYEWANNRERVSYPSQNPGNWWLK